MNDDFDKINSEIEKIMKELEDIDLSSSDSFSMPNNELNSFEEVDIKSNDFGSEKKGITSFTKPIKNNKKIKEVKIKTPKEKKKFVLFKKKNKNIATQTINEMRDNIANSETKSPRIEIPNIEIPKVKLPNVEIPTIKKQSKKNKVIIERPKAKKSTFAFAIVMSIILFICFVGAVGASAFAIKLCSGIPTLHKEDLVSPDSSVIYDNEGNKIMEIGMYLRENIEYEEMPNCLIDAFLAVEDSRFFEHIGFDLPRFTKAALVNLQSGDFSQGGSTVTMQLIKNSYFSIDADDQSTIASREGMSGIKRKMQEIVLALELEMRRDVSKQEIIAMYINKVNYGNNIRGVEKASEYYFGKKASQLNLPESAFLAGIINSPNTYNPYNNLYRDNSEYLDPDSDYLANATERRNEVLNLMVQHGYISEQECALAKSVKMEDLLCGVKDSFSEVNQKYQWYIDAVIDEVEESTGESPYLVGMNIYTNMNSYMQELIYDMQNEAEYTNIEFPNELCQSALVLIDNQTGAVEALGGGRGEADSARKFNRATSAYLNPGSSIKPVVDYSLAIENLGWATSHMITDQPYYLYNGNVLVTNFDAKYYGDMPMTEALGRSQNTPAVQTLVAVVDKIGEDKIVDYLNSIGFNVDYEDFDLQFAIGGNRCLTTPLQMAGAHAIFMNDGMYVKPHTINYIEYVDGRENFVADTIGTRVLSSETAWMTAYLEYYNMYGNFSSLMWYCKRDYPLYGKTGTTDWAEAGVDYGIPAFSTKDSWLIMQTNRYTISCWTGYDELQKGAYFTNAEYQENTKSKLVDLILTELETHASYKDYDPTIELTMPAGVKEITSVPGTYPYVLSGSGITGYIREKDIEENTGTLEEATAYAQEHNKYVSIGVDGLQGFYDGNQVTCTFGIAQGGAGGLISGDNVDISTTNLYGETTHASGYISFPHWNTIYSGSCTPPFLYRICVGGLTSDQDEQVITSGSTDSTSFTVPVSGFNKIKACVWTADSTDNCIEIPLSAPAPTD